jgi:hypothetical protein
MKQRALVAPLALAIVITVLLFPVSCQAGCARSGTTVNCSDGSSLRTIGRPGYQWETYTDRFGSFTTYQGRFQGGTGAYRHDPRQSSLAPMPSGPLSSKPGIKTRRPR